jgi:hypothetical protein
MVSFLKGYHIVQEGIIILVPLKVGFISSVCTTFGFGMVVV